MPAFGAGDQEPMAVFKLPYEMEVAVATRYVHDAGWGTGGNPNLAIDLFEGLHGFTFSSSSAILKHRSDAIFDACSAENTSLDGLGFQHIDASPMASNTAWYISLEMRKQIGRLFTGSAIASSLDITVDVKQAEPSGNIVTSFMLRDGRSP